MTSRHSDLLGSTRHPLQAWWLSWKAFYLDHVRKPGRRRFLHPEQVLWSQVPGKHETWSPLPWEICTKTWAWCPSGLQAFRGTPRPMEFWADLPLNHPCPSTDHKRFVPIVTKLCKVWSKKSSLSKSYLSTVYQTYLRVTWNVILFGSFPLIKAKTL